MTTITERMGYASDAAHDFADAAMVQLFALLSIRECDGDQVAAARHPVVLAALIDAAARVYAAERQHEAAELIAEAINDAGQAIREISQQEALLEIADALGRMKSVVRDAVDLAERCRKAVPE